MTQERIIIPTSKAKIVKLFSISLLFVASGTWMLVSNADDFNIIILLVSMSALVFFGACAITLLIKLFDRRPGLVIDDIGVTDNASGVSAGLIPWEDITGISTTSVMNEDFIMIYVVDPEKYIKRQSNFLKRKMMGANWKTYGSPITISANGLKINIKNLMSQLNERRKAYKNIQA